ncbi:MAG TPA: lasso peptide biosynthesis B2 protein [Vicinamibacterales bacterium]|nr:lasso peptide biosynthesis B2 protein [Vicinamibacterales bacterium]
MSGSSIGRWCGNAVAVGRLFPAYVAFAVLKRLVPVQTLARWAWQPPRGASNPEHIRQAVARVWRTQGLANLGDRDCLQRSLLLYRELSRLGANPTLMIGFRQAASQTQGHAWVVARDALGLEPPDLTQYVPAFGFGPHGELVKGPRESF